MNKSFEDFFCLTLQEIEHIRLDTFSIQEYCSDYPLMPADRMTIYGKEGVEIILVVGPRTVQGKNGIFLEAIVKVDGIVTHREIV